ncbi:FecR family protein [Arcticibacter sp.]|jgi:ferric-dicitrate binding protein FerR (iron transport regulator)|uniref:FecR family protein n=1 Tax=Arcticibacter sp. TaxID=1872630 RepID=UPI00388E8FDA
MDNTDRVWTLIARSLSHEASGEELEELSVYLERYPEIDNQYTLLKTLWDTGDTFNEDSCEKEECYQVNKIFQRAKAESGNDGESPLRETETTIRAQRSFAVPINWALLVAAALICIIYYNRHAFVNASSDLQKQTIIVENGTRTKLLLPDGTTVWLNGDSKLYYDEDFSGPVREVRLEGEGFFDVVKDDDKPFIVHVGDVNIKVLGTAFNVKNYQGDKHIETTLLRGKIEVSGSSNESKSHIFLEPNQKLIVPAKAVNISAPNEQNYQIVSLDESLKEEERVETAWIYNRVEFRGESFAELKRKLERWYNVDINLEDEPVKALRFNGSFEKESVDEAFEALQKVASFKYKRKGREVFIESSN